MKIAIDARTWFLRSGVGRYVRGMVGALVERFPDDQFILFLSNQKTTDDFPVRSSNVELHISEADLNNATAEQTILADEINRSGAEVVWFPFYIYPRRVTVPAVVTLLDLTFIHHPEFHLTENIDYLTGYLDDALTGAHAITTISCYVRDDLFAYAKSAGLCLDPERVSVIYPGVDESFFRKERDNRVAEVAGRYGLRPDGYTLYVGSIEPRKNVCRLLEAYDRLKIAIPLALAGLERWKPEAYRATFAALRHPERIRPLGFVPDGDLPALYQGARLMAYPSLSEGFGLPVAEAYASGAPVITSHNSSLAEIGKAGWRVDPYDREALQQGLERLLSDGAERERLRQRGYAAGDAFRWPTAAIALHSVMATARG